MKTEAFESRLTHGKKRLGLVGGSVEKVEAGIEEEGEGEGRGKGWGGGRER